MIASLDLVQVHVIGE